MTTREDDNNLRRLVLRTYWDEEAASSLLCPLGDFFGLGETGSPEAGAEGHS